MDSEENIKLKVMADLEHLRRMEVESPVEFEEEISDIRFWLKKGRYTLAEIGTTAEELRELERKGYILLARKCLFRMREMVALIPGRGFIKRYPMVYDCFPSRDNEVDDFQKYLRSFSINYRRGHLTLEEIGTDLGEMYQLRLRGRFLPDSLWHSFG